MELFQQGGILMYLILLGSVIGLAVFLERLFHLHRARINTDKFMSRIRKLVTEQKVREAITLCEATPGPVAHIVGSGMARAARTRGEIKESIEDAGLQEVPRLEKNLVVLATIAHISPLLGLLGTVLGMIRAFRTIEEMRGMVSPSDLAGGIWEALLTTAFGLVVAILAYVGYNYLVSRVGKMVLEMETSASELLNLLSESDSESKAESIEQRA